MFAEALGEDDEYVRLQKISLGIKEVSLNLRNMQIITDHNILKSMICSYPFQQASIELLISAFFDYFKHKLFLFAFYRALQDVSELQEYREFLGNRSTRSLKMTFKYIKIYMHSGNVNKIIEEQQKQGSTPFSKQVIEKLLIAKRFACSYLKRFFLLAIQLNVDLEEMSIIFKQFITHTRCQKFQQQLIDQFFDCKQSIFYEFPWKNKYDYELDDFCNRWTIEIAPKWILDRKKSMSSFNYIGTEKQIKTEQDDEYITPASKVESVSDYVEIMQKIICKPIEMVTQHDQLQLHNNDNIEILIKFIINPLETELIDDWGLLFQKKDIDSNDYKTTFKSSTIPMDYLNTVRSFKSLQFLTQKVNHSRFYLTIQDMTPKIFEQIIESLNNQSIQLNLNHLAILIDQLLLICPKASVLKIIELDFLFLFLQYSSNPFIESLIIDILDLTVDKYKLGFFIQKQIWQYILETKWIEYLSNAIFQQNYSIANLKFPVTEKDEEKQQILNFLSKFKDVQKPIEIVKISTLDEFIGPLGGSANSQNLEEHIQYPENISYAQLLENDVDAIRAYLDERRVHKSINYSRKQSTKAESQMTTHRTPTVSHSRNISLNVPTLPSINTPKSVSNKQSELQFAFNDSKSKRGSVEKLEKHEKSVSSKTSLWAQNLQQTSRSSLSSETGFSSSKLIMLYPSGNQKANPSQFEIHSSEFYFNANTFEHLINLLEKIVNVIAIHQMRNLDNGEHFCNLVLNQELVLSLFKFYLYEIHMKKDVSFQCGKIINSIYYLAKRYGNAEQQEFLREIFYSTIEYLNKIIINLNRQNLDLSFTSQFILFQTINNGFAIFEPYDATKLNRNIYKFLSETTIHLYIIFFFKSKQNSLYQYQFVEFINMIFEKAPTYLLQNILFNVGLISSLYNAYTTFYANGFKSSQLQ
ncbi:unnamed protein product (macronuclear) [Paramecium tetraurelia]|uniref:Uncharacterized protein n=1 Tax=Paramecium tetraurelia TaxID=5888 RepID=A0DP97_PARTE|nr:uncharacterized protein GSPATT00019046001 [Paramecium tetraurelia]CAK84864.1 unnamed protein product [Paramecium tetraurelia]|eukprot:XP_001452261.1 hypothetical protein (macronuclear) [Paramecium tetraurelia strain d4-2]